MIIFEVNVKVLINISLSLCRSNSSNQILGKKRGKRKRVFHLELPMHLRMGLQSTFQTVPNLYLRCRINRSSQILILNESLFMIGYGYLSHMMIPFLEKILGMKRLDFWIKRNSLVLGIGNIQGWLLVFMQ
jgi:hypothetical protein